MSNMSKPETEINVPGKVISRRSLLIETALLAVMDITTGYHTYVRLFRPNNQRGTGKTSWIRITKIDEIELAGGKQAW